MLSKAKKLWNLITICRLHIQLCVSYFTYSTMHRCWKTYMHENINMDIYPGVWLIKQPSKLIWKAYNYLRWTAKCQFLTFCCLQYWLEVIFLVPVIFSQNCVWKVLTQQICESRELLNYKSCWTKALQSFQVPLELSKTYFRMEIQPEMAIRYWF